MCASYFLFWLTVQFCLVSTDVHVTTAQNDAKERVKGMALGEYEGIAVVGGDGLVYEVVNGLMERPDAAQVRHKTMKS
jgi:sphingosine kinase